MSFTPFKWKCPHCELSQVVTQACHQLSMEGIYLGETAIGNIGYGVQTILCSSGECNQPSVRLIVAEWAILKGQWTLNFENIHFNRQVIPDSSYRSFPPLIPAPILEDYQEACSIRNLSPKASATLARRCLQGMIRDFCGITKSTLDQEIRALKEMLDAGTAPKGVSHESVDAIDHVRTVGNIGAHMEKDVNHIVTVEPNEAQILIDLIETLFDEWYVERRKRKDRFEKVRLLAEQKKADKKVLGGNPSGQP